LIPKIYILATAIVAAAGESPLPNLVSTLLESVAEGGNGPSAMEREGKVDWLPLLVRAAPIEGRK
jgi:hypothetical protein